MQCVTVQALLSAEVIALLYLGHPGVCTVLDLHAACRCESQYAVSCENTLDLKSNFGSLFVFLFCFIPL